MGMCDEAWPCQEASVVLWEACKVGSPGHKTIRLHVEACKAGALQNTCMCTRKLGQGQRPLKSMLVYEGTCTSGGPKDIPVCAWKLGHGRRP